jgi:FkbM family methyltransferase
LSNLKQLARDAIPVSWQVPLKYWSEKARGVLEPEMALLPQLVRAGDRVIDVGGNRGAYAYRFWKLGALVEVFEPNPACARVLSGWAAARKRVRVHPVALSSAEGMSHLHVPVDENGVEHDASASLEGELKGSVRNVEVHLRELDSFGFSDPALIKIDVEGHEPERHRGGRRNSFQSTTRPYWWKSSSVICARPISDTFLALRAHGYQGFFLLDGKLAPLDRFDAARHQSIRLFEAGKAGYHNNFLFLAEERIEADVMRL